MTDLISDRAFEVMVNVDLRDKDGTAPGWAVLRAPINRLRWLNVLVGIRESINTQNAQANAALKAHPGRADGKPSFWYLQAKAEHEDRKRQRMRMMQAVRERITEAQQLIGMTPVPQVAAGKIALALTEIDQFLADGAIADARPRLRNVLRSLNESEGARL